MLGQLAESRLQAAVDIISRGKVVVTNRLHAAVVANLVGRPLIWIDTAQKKISGERGLLARAARARTPRWRARLAHARRAGAPPLRRPASDAPACLPAGLAAGLAARLPAPAGVRSLAFSHSTACTEAHMHSRQAGDLAEAVALAQQWLGSQDFVWSLHHQGPGAAAQ
jgi:hypothetical protein